MSIKENWYYTKPSKTTHMEADVLVLGGGIAGCMAAISAARTPGDPGSLILGMTAKQADIDALNHALESSPLDGKSPSFKEKISISISASQNPGTAESTDSGDDRQTGRH